MEPNDELKLWLDKDLDDIYIFLGTRVDALPRRYPDGSYIIQKMKLQESLHLITMDEIKGKSRKFIDDNAIKLRQIICPKYNKNTNTFDDAATIITAISAFWDTTVPIASAILAIVVKRGLSNFCDSQ